MKLALSLCALALPTIGLVAIGQDSQKAKPRPVDVFKELDGHWSGTFVGYDTTGKELYRIRVEQWYRTVDANTQEVRIRDTMPDGKVITGKGKNIATRQKDGSLALRCIVEKSTGERVTHQGRLVRGPTGSKQIMWYSNKEKRSETFREWVSSGPPKTYHIHGMGTYGSSKILMAGHYQLQTKTKR